MHCLFFLIVLKKLKISLKKKKKDICDMFAQSIDCAYTLEPPRRGGSNEYPQSVFWSKNKNTCTLKSLYTRKIGVQGGIHYKDTQWAHDVRMTSYQRRCDVMTSHRRRSDVILMSCACWACFWPFSDCSLLRSGSFLVWLSISEPQNWFSGIYNQ